MAITYSLADNPKWYFADLTGLPLGGGYLAAFSSLNPTMMKLIYQDMSGLFRWPTVTIPNQSTTLGIQIDENGTLGPLYFAFDSDNPNDNYYLEVYDANGVLQWTIDDFFPSGGGGGAVVTTAININNILVNNVFWRNVGNVVGSQFIVLAPGVNTGLALTNALSPEMYGPDIVFVKNNNSATDSLSFIPFAAGDTPFTNDVTPTQYLNYTCTGSGSSETFKYVQIPITQNVKNLQNQTLTFTIWARSNVTPHTLTCQIKQFFGDGSAPSLPFNIPILPTFSMNGTWQKFTQTVNIPSVAGKIIGECGNDGLFLQIQYPLDVICNIDIAKPSLFLGDIAPDEDYQTFDSINSVIDSPRTGHKKESYTAIEYGWVPLNDGTIGSSASTATTRANIDTFPLYNLIWNHISRTFCPVIGGAGASAVADFIANKPISLPKSLDRVAGAAGLTYQLGEFEGSVTQTLSIANLAAHTHSATSTDQTIMNFGPSDPSEPPGVGFPNAIIPVSFTHAIPMNVTSAVNGIISTTIGSTGSNTPFSILQPTTFDNKFIKL